MFLENIRQSPVSLELAYFKSNLLWNNKKLNRTSKYRIVGLVVSMGNTSFSLPPFEMAKNLGILRSTGSSSGVSFQIHFSPKPLKI